MADKLRDRAQAAASTEVAPRRATMSEQIEAMRDEYQKAMPRGMEATQLVRDAHTALRKTPKLADCTPASFLGGLMNIAQLGLRVGVLGQAWLLPLWNSKDRCYEAQLIIGYRGMTELAYRTGVIKSIRARSVRDVDDFHVSYGLHEDLRHVPVLHGDRGEPAAYYAVAEFYPPRPGLDAGHAFWVFTHQEMIDHRDKFAMAKTKDGRIVGPWRDNFESMALKTCIRALSRYMPQATELNQAIAADETIRVDSSIDPDAMLTGKHVTQDDYVPAGDDDGPAEDEQAPPDPQG